MKSKKERKHKRESSKTRPKKKKKWYDVGRGKRVQRKNKLEKKAKRIIEVK